MDRQQAIATNSTRYNGRVCSKHSELNGERKTSNNTCVGCLNKRAAKHMAKHRMNNKSQVSEYMSLWRKNNRHIINFHISKYRASVRQATPGWFEKEKVELVYKKAFELGMSVDHVVPITSNVVCGLHCWANLQLLDQPLNSGKRNYYWPDMP